MNTNRDLKDFNRGQQCMLVALTKMIAQAPHGMHRVHLLSHSEHPLVCHFGKTESEVVMDTDTWDGYTLVTGDVLNRDGEVKLILQSFVDVSPHLYGDLNRSESAQVVIGWVVDLDANMTPMKASKLQEELPEREIVRIPFKPVRVPVKYIQG